MGGILVVECKFWNEGGLLQVCGLWFVEEFRNLVPEVVCLGSWFQNLIILKVSRFQILESIWIGSHQSCTPK